MRSEFLLKIMSLSIVLCSTVSLFGMRSNCKTKLTLYKKHQPIVVDYEKTLQESKKAFQEVDQMLIEDGVRNAYINKDILLRIGYDHDVKNELKNTCRFMHKIFSKTKHNMYQFALNKARFSKKDTDFIILSAAWDKRTDVMISMLNNTQERLFYYDAFIQYAYPKHCGKRYVFFDLPTLCEINKMGNYDNKDDERIFALNIKDDKENNFRCDLKIAPSQSATVSISSKTIKTISLMMTVYSGVMEDIIYALSSGIDEAYDLIKAFKIAVDQNNSDCIRVLSSKAKEMKQMGFIFSTLYYDVLFMTAMMGNKKEAFETLVEEDPLDCLNACASGRSTLDRLWMVYVDNQDEYINIYKKHGGKSYFEMFREGIAQEEKEREKREVREKIQTPASSCLIS